MSVSLVIRLPRTPLPLPSRRTLRLLFPLAAPVLVGAAEATGVGLPGRLILGAALGAAEDALNS
ncbi:hypothetical protein [Streptomyces meridianus]|uniref:Prenyltransferase n=1 Tax=Streptomyces meridianus TaxID=2938945 RepID=A0ABT0XC08_9ACTN|nr:hypothetical protein [Streptomyces meridianus]MCM2580046.1 hypothetical protein [Streptomyces meridianus]